MHVAERMKIVLGARAERHHRFCKPKPESFCGRASAIVSRRGNRKVWFLSLMYVASLRRTELEAKRSRKFGQC